MKHKIILVMIAILISSYCYSQCNAKIILSATGVEIMDKNNDVKSKDTERITTIKYDTRAIEINTEYNTRYGSIDSVYCNWSVPYKEGRTYLRGKLNFENGYQWVIKLTITGKEGKLTLLADMEHPDASVMRFALTTYEENK